MKKIFTVLLLLIFCVGVLFFSIASVNLNAKDAECKNKSTGDVCVGECCKTTPSGCEAGPCSFILEK